MALLEEKLVQVQNGKDGDPGPQGQPGERGEPGSDADMALIGGMIHDVVEGKVLSILNDLPQPKKGEKGDPGERGEPGADGKDVDIDTLTAMVNEVLPIAWRPCRHLRRARRVTQASLARRAIAATWGRKESQGHEASLDWSAMMGSPENAEKRALPGILGVMVATASTASTAKTVSASRMP